jgi:hypothetical protein
MSAKKAKLRNINVLLAKTLQNMAERVETVVICILKTLALRCTDQEKIVYLGLLLELKSDCNGVDASCAINDESDTFEKLVAVGYNLLNMTTCMEKIHCIINSNWTAVGSQHFEVMMARIVTLCSALLESKVKLHRYDVGLASNAFTHMNRRDQKDLYPANYVKWKPLYDQIQALFDQL